MKNHPRFMLLAALILSVCLLSGSALSETVSLPEKIEKSPLAAGSGILPLLKLRSSDRALNLSTDDKVTVNEDGSVLVQSAGVSMLITPPFGWVVLTQDVLAQLETYLMLTDKVEDLQVQMKQTNTHACTLDLLTMSSVEFRMEEDALSRIFENIRDIPEDYLPKMIELLKVSYGADDVTVLDAGNNRFFKMNGGGIIVYTTYINGVTMDLVCCPSGETFTDSETETIESMLAALVLS